MKQIYLLLIASSTAISLNQTNNQDPIDVNIKVKMESDETESKDMVK